MDGKPESPLEEYNLLFKRKLSVRISERLLSGALFLRVFTWRDEFFVPHTTKRGAFSSNFLSYGAP
jgi:hypothetical protein